MTNEKISLTDEGGGRVSTIARLLATAERELSAFIVAVNKLFGAEAARHAAEDWIEEFAWTDWPCENPLTDCRRVTIVAATGLANRVKRLRSRN
jgi:hypothetical protein